MEGTSKQFGHFYGSNYVTAPDGSRTPVSNGCLQVATQITPSEFINFDLINHISRYLSIFIRSELNCTHTRDALF